MRTNYFRNTLCGLGLGLVLACVGCGGDEGTPIISGAVTGSYKGTPFTGSFGFAKERSGQSSLIGVGAGPINCTTPDAPEPPTGNNAIISLTSLAVGSYTSVAVQLLHNDGDYEGYGSNTGTVQITASTSTSVSGSVAFTITQSGATSSINGNFEVVHCN